MLIRQRTNTCTGIESEEVTCNEFDGVFSQWSSWSACSADCGGGERARSRIHSCTGVVDTEKEQCNLDGGESFSPSSNQELNAYGLH